MEIKKLAENKKLSLSLIFSGAGIIILVTALVLFSVFSKHKKDDIKVYSDAQRDLIFDIGCKAVSGSSEYPFSDSLKRILSHHFIKGQSTLILLEVYFPQCYGIAEGLGFYVPADDQGLWVEETLIRAEEERIAKELREMEESLEELNDFEDEFGEDFEGEFDEEADGDFEDEEGESDESEDGDEESEETEAEKRVSEYHSERADSIERTLENQKEPSYYMNKNSELGILYNDGEILIPTKTDDGYSIIMANDQKVIRRFYNDQMRLVKKETWPAREMNKKTPESIEEMKYSEDGKTLVSKLIESGDDYTMIYYNADGLTRAVERYIMYEKKKYTLLKRSCSYNEEGKITVDETTDYVYSGADYKKLKYTFTKKYIYEYNEGDIPPDFKYYENGVMKMHNKYASEKGTYTSQIFFDGNLSVKSYYEEDRHIRDVYYNGNRILREKVYEQQ